jgi:hypothetical protein
LRGRFQALRTVTSVFLMIIHFGCWTCIVRVFQPFSRCNRAEQLIPPRQSLSFLLLPFRCLSLFLLFIISLPGSIIKVTNIVHQLTVRALCRKRKLSVRACAQTLFAHCDDETAYLFIKYYPS